jgi:hypothetical protein
VLFARTLRPRTISSASFDQATTAASVLNQ